MTLVTGDDYLIIFAGTKGNSKTRNLICKWRGTNFYYGKHRVLVLPCDKIVRIDKW